MSFKVPCGGFKLDEKSFSLDKNDVLSISKPLTYDYMPDGYPKKDGWSVEWDGNIDGKLYIPIEGDYGLCKISDMVLTYDDLLGAEVEFLDSPENTVMIAADSIEISPRGVVYVEANFSFNSVQYYIYFCITKEDNMIVDGSILPEKGVYVDSGGNKFKMTKENITLMSTDFIPLVSETEPGLSIPLDSLYSNVLQQVHDEYFAGSNSQMSGYSNAETVKKYADKNNSYGISQPGKFSGKVLNAWNYDTDKYLTFVLADDDKVECRKASSGSTDIEQLWCISKDGVVIQSSTPDSTKKFKITVDDSGTISATEVT